MLRAVAKVGALSSCAQDEYRALLDDFVATALRSQNAFWRRDASWQPLEEFVIDSLLAPGGRAGAQRGLAELPHRRGEGYAPSATT